MQSDAEYKKFPVDISFTQPSYVEDTQWSHIDLDDSYFQAEDDYNYKIGINVVVLSVCDIQTTSQSWQMRLEIWTCWPLTKKEGIAYGHAIQAEKEDGKFDWEPRIHPIPAPWTIEISDACPMLFANGRSIQVLINRGKLIACECLLVTAKYLESLELDSFPFDCQFLTFHIAIRSDTSCPLKIITANDGTEAVRVENVKNDNGYFNFDGRTMSNIKLDDQLCCFNVRRNLLSVDEFMFHGIEMEIDNKVDDVPFVHCTIKLSRFWYTYIARIFVYMFMLILITALVLRVQHDYIERLGYIASMLLTVVAFNLTVSAWLPQLSYMTLLDWHMMASFSSIVILGVQVAIIEELHNARNHDADPDNNPDADPTVISDLESWIFYVDLIVIVAAHIFLAVHCFFLRRFEMAKMQMTVAEVEKLYSFRTGNGPEQYLCHGDPSCVSRGQTEKLMFDAEGRKTTDPSLACKSVFVGQDRAYFDHGWLPLDKMRR